MSQFSKKELFKFRESSQANNVDLWKGTSSGPIVGYESTGYLGQRLVIYPEYDIVALRMVKPSKDYNPKTDGFGDFSDMIYKLASK